MKVLTEADLRADGDSRISGEYRVPGDTFVTESAREYLRDKGVRLITESDILMPHASMTHSPYVKNGEHTYIDAVTGEGYSEKSEAMTHLRGNLLVSKTHPRIALRGKLDGLQAKVLLLQRKYTGNKALLRDLGDVLKYIRAILGAEVKAELLEETLLFGFTHEELRRRSHYVKEIFGIDHPIPDCTMTETALELNALRTQVREAELCAAVAFEGEDFLGLIEHLNRLSSGIYILFCREVSGKEV